MFVYQFQYKDIPILLRKQYCPQCGNKMIRSYSSKIVPRKEVEPSRMTIGDVSFPGDLEERQVYYYCYQCDAKFSIDDIRQKNRRYMK